MYFYMKTDASCRYAYVYTYQHPVSFLKSDIVHSDLDELMSTQTIMPAISATALLFQLPASPGPVPGTHRQRADHLLLAS